MTVIDDIANANVALDLIHASDEWQELQTALAELRGQHRDEIQRLLDEHDIFVEETLVRGELAMALQALREVNNG
jgi:hypothetical protein